MDGFRAADSRNTQRRLQEANAVLDAAYRRVRRELLGLSYTGSPGHSNPSAQSLMNPGHQAMVLAESPDASINPMTEGGSDPGIPSPSLPLHVAQPPQLEDYLTHRGLHDDSATLIGRRVAAREASRTSSTSESAQSASALFRRPRPSSALELSTEDPQRQRRLEHESRIIERRLRDRGSLDFLLNSRTSTSETNPTGVDARNRLEPSQEERAQSPRSSISHDRSSSILGSILSLSRRLSLLTDVSLRNFASPSSTLFLPPPQDDSHAFSPSESANQSTGETNTAAETRSYVIRRRLNSDGEEVVRHINLSLNDESDSSLLRAPSEAAQYNSVQRLSSAENGTGNTERSTQSDPLYAPRWLELPSTSSGPLRRRGGWARINADGDMVPIDEEEELEQLYILRARNRNRRRGAERGNHDPRTYSDMPFSESPIDDTVPLPNDRALQHSQYELGPYGGIGEPFEITGEGADGYGKQLGNSGSFQPSALPMSLSEMVPSGNSRYAEDDLIPVSEHANLACR